MEATLAPPVAPERVESAEARVGQVTPPATAPTRRTGGVTAEVLFGGTAFLASALLFVSEPLVARTLLPVLGGSASVWNTAMFAFQALLLAGYALAHAGLTRLGVRRHAPASAVVAFLAIVSLPIGLRAGWQPPVGASPALWTLGALLVAVGLPFLVLATVSPSLQRWYAEIRPGRDPYVLYAAGNAGSFLGLLAYPLVLERTLTIRAQATAWTSGYLVFAVVFLTCALWARRCSPAGPAAARVALADGIGTAGKPSRRAMVRWTAMAAAPSALLLGVTRHLATDVAAIPLLWVVPLGLYLLTFVVAFSGRSDRMASTASRAFRLVAVPMALSLIAPVRFASFALGGSLVLFAAGALAIHGRLAASRPPVRQLTSFYLALSCGGAIGGALAGLIAPMIFPSILEYPVAIVACLVCLAAPEARMTGRVRRLALGGFAVLVAAAGLLHVTTQGDDSLRWVIMLLGVASVLAYAASRRAGELAAAMALVLVVVTALPGEGTLAQRRTFFGVTRVLSDAQGRHLLLSGTTVHGAQDPRDPGRPLTYYARQGPIGDVLDRVVTGPRRSVGVIGLGAGSLAAYGHPGDRFTFYEIDPAVIDIAENPALFTFLSDSMARVRVVEGDGRLALRRDGDARYDLLVIDAFSSDSIPIHLVTTEALRGYRARLRPHGRIAFHISNRYFDLEPVLGRLASSLGLEAVVRDAAPTEELAQSTTWVVLAERGDMRALAGEPGWRVARRGPSLWTDDRADVLGARR